MPSAYMPPAGMCRIWVQGVPADKQPAPTDCPTALRNSPPNGRVIFGPSKDTARSGALSGLLRSKALPLPAALSGGRVAAPPAGAAATRSGPARTTSAGAARDSLLRRDSLSLRDSSRRRDSTIRRDSVG